MTTTNPTMSVLGWQRIDRVARACRPFSTWPARALPAARG